MNHILEVLSMKNDGYDFVEIERNILATYFWARSDEILELTKQGLKSDLFTGIRQTIAKDLNECFNALYEPEATQALLMAKSSKDLNSLYTFELTEIMFKHGLINAKSVELLTNILKTQRIKENLAKRLSK